MDGRPNGRSKAGFSNLSSVDVDGVSILHCFACLMLSEHRLGESSRLLPRLKLIPTKRKHHVITGCLELAKYRTQRRNMSWNENRNLKTF